ncbi:MAG: APC family permease [Actinobacteria bacterium]|nr:MAG: APC family permease [Actinomycetota bacterium]
MAEAVVEERQLLKTLRWYDGFVICLANPGFLLGSLGNSVLDMGGWGAMLIWGITALIIVPVTIIYSELAAMFPHKSGGLSIYANEGWRKYTTLVGPIATFGYWIGWSVVLAFLGLFTGSIAQAAWFPGQPYGTSAFGGKTLDNGYFSTGTVHIGLQHLIGIGLIVAVWIFNVLGTRIAVSFAYLAGLLLMVPLFCFTLLPFLNGDFHSANLTYKLNDPGLAWGGWQLALVWIWLMIWSTAPEAAATFAPEYKDTVRDTRKALLSSAAFIVLINTVVPLSLTGGVGEKTVSGFDYVGALDKLVGSGATNFFVVVMCFSFVLSMNTATADGSRALYAISKDGLTIKELGVLNRFNVPGNAMSLDMVINILFVLFVGNIFGILAASNIGYVLANAFAISAFVLLRRDRPNWPRPIKLPSYWIPIAVVLFAAFIVFSVVGIGWFQIAAGGYGKGAQIKIIGFAVLAISFLLFLFRRIVQDKERPHWREETPTMPEEAPSPAVVGAPGVSAR